MWRTTLFHVNCCYNGRAAGETSQKRNRESPGGYLWTLTRCENRATGCTKDHVRFEIVSCQQPAHQNPGGNKKLATNANDVAMAQKMCQVTSAPAESIERGFRHGHRNTRRPRQIKICFKECSTPANVLMRVFRHGPRNTWRPRPIKISFKECFTPANVLLALRRDHTFNSVLSEVEERKKSKTRKKERNKSLVLKEVRMQNSTSTTQAAEESDSSVELYLLVDGKWQAVVDEGDSDEDSGPSTKHSRSEASTPEKAQGGMVKMSQERNQGQKMTSTPSNRYTDQDVIWLDYSDDEVSQSQPPSPSPPSQSRPTIPMNAPPWYSSQYSPDMNEAEGSVMAGGPSAMTGDWKPDDWKCATEWRRDRVRVSKPRISGVNIVVGM